MRVECFEFKWPYHSFVAFSLLFPALSPFVLAAAEAKVEEKGEGIMEDRQGRLSIVLDNVDENSSREESRTENEI